MAGRLIDEQQGGHAQETIDAQLDHHRREHRADRGRRGSVEVRLPEVEGERGAFDHEGHQQEGDGHRHQRHPGIGSDAHGQISHIQRAERNVEHADSQQQAGRSDQAGVEVLQRGLDAECVIRGSGQDRAGEHQQFGEDEQVEQVAGQDRAGQPGGHGEEQRVKRRVADHLVLAAHRVDDAHRQHQLAHEHHEGRQHVAHKGDAEGNWPAARLVDQRLPTAPYLSQQQRAARQCADHHAQRPARLHARIAAQQQRHRRADQRDDDGKKDQL